MAHEPRPGAPRAPRYRALDLWRGVASLFVVVFHATAVWAARPPRPLAELGPLDQLAELLLAVTRQLDAGVPMFFVISGYCISATADAARLREEPVRSYFVRRVRRIFPPYWGALVVQTALLFLVDVVLAPGLLTNSVAPIQRPWTFTPGQYLGNLTLTESWRTLVGGGAQGYLLGQAWTLCYEEQFYLVTGVLLAVARRHLFRGMMLVTLAILPVRWLADRTGTPLWGTFLDGRWLMFAAGIAVYWATNHGAPRWRTAWASALAIGLAWAVHTGDRHLGISMGFALIVLALKPYDAATTELRVHGPLSALGALCYSLYLVHAPVARGVSQALANAGWGDAWSTLLLAVPLSVALSLALASVFHRTIERRFLNPPRPAPRP